VGFVTGFEPAADRPRTPGRCAECGTPLAHDQHYCLHCGARRGRVPPRVAATLAALAGAAAAAGPAQAAPAAARELIPGASKILASISPRAATLAMMSMLAFGVVVGSGTTSLAQGSGSPLVVVGQSSTALAAAPVPPVPSAPSGGGGGGGAAPAAAPAAASAAPAAAAQETVTVPAPKGGGGGGGSSPTVPPVEDLPPIKHVFLVMLSDQSYQQSFGPHSAFPYLAKTLRKQGELLANYYAVAPSPLSNGIAVLSGQGPTVQTAVNCPNYTPITPAKTGKESQVLGNGCMYPISAQTLPDQLTAAGRSWKAYVEGVESGPAGTAKTCRHPQLNSADPDQTPQPGDPYVTWRNPFVYFQSLSPVCATNDVALPRLFKDLKSEKKTPSFSYIVPSACNDGSGMTCPPATPASANATRRTVTAGNPGILPALDPDPTDTTTGTSSTGTTTTSSTTTTSTTTSSTTTTSAPPLTSTTTSTSTTSGATTSIPSITTTPGFSAPTDQKAAGKVADGFLQSVIPKIEQSAAYKSGGLIAITFDEAPQTGPHADPSACCNNPVYPNLPPPSTTSTTTTAPGQTTTGTAPATSTTTTSTLPGTTTPTTGTETTSPTTTGTTTTSTTTAPLPISGGQTTPTGGGGQVGLLLISKYVKPGTSDVIDYYNHYSLLASIEALFSLKRLGYTTDPQLPFFDSATYNNFKP
jgi:phosphatidylinositol-3-phosphatase